MKTTIETIGGKKCTVIRKPFDAEFVRGQLAMGAPVMAEYNNSHCKEPCNVVLGFFKPTGHSIGQYKQWWEYTNPIPDFAFDDLHYTLTILPALPRSATTNKDLIYLAHLYAAQGIEVWVESLEKREDGEPILHELPLYLCGTWERIEVTHATDSEGNKIDIAIED